jgi:hypothetical protein
MHRRLPALVLATALLAGCQAAPATLPATQAVSPAEPWLQKPLVQPTSRPWTANPAAPGVTVNVDLAPLLRSLQGNRSLLGLGFGSTGVTSLVLTAEGPGIDSNTPVTATFTPNGTTLSGTSTLTVPAGHNRLFTLTAQDAGNNVLARIRTLGDVAQGQALTLTFNYNTDAAGRVLDDLYHRVDLGVTANATYVASLANADITAALQSYVSNFTGYQASSNTYGTLNPLYFKDWVVATSLIAGTLTPTTLGTNTNPGGTGDVSQEYRPTLVFFPAADDSTNGATIEVLDPVDRGNGGNAPTLGAVGTPSVWRSVPSGRWTVRITKSATVMTCDMYVPFDTTTKAFNVQLPSFAAGAAASALSVAVRTDLAPAAPTSVALPYGAVTTVAGSVQGVNNNASGLTGVTFDTPKSIAWDGTGLLISDHNGDIRRYNPSVPCVVHYIGIHGTTPIPNPPYDGIPASNITLFNTVGVAYAGNVVHVADFDAQRSYTFTGVNLAPDIGTATTNNPFAYIAARPDGTIFGSTGTKIWQHNPTGITPTDASLTPLPGTSRGVAVAATSGAIFYIAGNAIYMLDHDVSQTPTLIAGDPTQSGEANGAPTTARFNNPTNLAVSADGKRIWVADTDNNQVRSIEPNPYTGKFEVKRLAGGASTDPGNTTDGVGTNARFSSPQGLAYDGAGHLYVADTNNHRIRMIQVN